MNKFLRFFFPSVAVIRLLGVVAIFLIDKMRYDYRVRNGLDKNSWHLEFDWYYYALLYTLSIVFLINTLICLCLSFSPKTILTGLFRNKVILRFFYILELAFLPFLVYMICTEIQDVFFRPEPGYLESALDYLLGSSDAMRDYRKAEIINYTILVFCSLVFVICFWKYYSIQKQKYVEIVSLPDTPCMES